MAHTNTLELNGKRYDAGTGKVLDGFLPSRLHPGASPAKAGAHPSRPTARQVKHHQPEHAKTLMRQAVKKPHTKPTNSPTISDAIATVTHAAFAPIEHLNSERIARAQKIHKSKLVSRFGGFSPVVSQKTVHMPVQPAPHSPHHKHEVSVAQQRVAHAKPVTSSKGDVFTEALKRADSLAEPLQRTTKTRHKVAKKLGISARALSVSAGVLAVVVLAGFFGYQNTANLSMRVAAAKAGIHAKLPSYHPSGFAIRGPIQYSPGQITVSFKSHADDRNFKLTQQTSNWNTDTLLNKYVTVNSQPYQTFEANDKTIYIYGNSNATWVNNGIWYQISGNSSLNSDQLLHIASSL
ncbi:MAG: hypothetical protein JWS12_776 [Candidatus Saccharibacteria bacterium]|nr:hypothetical protein [Candidatus Saccharibacteria bacterium]